jgi:hypothetical protein
MRNASLSPALAAWAFLTSMRLVLAARMLQSLWALYLFVYHYRQVVLQLQKSGKI